MKGKRRIRHTISGNPFNKAVSVNEKTADVTAEHSKEADSNGWKFAVRGGVRCCRIWFRVIVRRTQVDVMCSLNVAAPFPEAFTKMRFVPFSCTDQVPVCGLEGTAHSAKKSFTASQSETGRAVTEW